MALIVYEGTLGGGKSYHAVQHALRYLSRGGRIYSNITLVQSACESFCRSRYGVELNWSEQFHFLTANDISRLHEVVKGGDKDCPVLCILDEIHLYHNARDWSQASRGLLQWLTQSRKLFVDIIAITQHRNNLDKQWVRLVERYFRFRDLRRFKMPGLGISFPFFQCLSVEIDTDGKTVIDRKWERFDIPVFSCYSSEQLFDGCVSGFAGAGQSRVKLDKVKGKKVKVYVMVGIVVLVLVVAGVSCFRRSPLDTFRVLTGKKSVEVPKASPASRPSAPSSRPSAPVPVPVPSLPDWVVCDGWTARGGDIIGGYSSRYRLTFRGPPDRIEDGEPVYAFRRGVMAY